jgi:primary-amine oxidase
MTVDEWHECDETLRHRPRLVAALARRGITDMSLVLVDVWAYGRRSCRAYRGRRVGWGDVWYRETPRGQPVRTPGGGMHPIVDLNSMELLEIDDVETPSSRPT